MKYNEITLFRRFLSDKGTMNNFEFFFNNHRLKNITFNKYLETVDAEDVILNAFDMSCGRNTIFNFQYWKRLDEKWQEKLFEFRKTGKITIAEESILCPHCKRMMPKSMFTYNRKGGLHKHCIECENGDWDRRRKREEQAAREDMSIAQIENEIAERELNLTKTTKVCDHCGKRKLRSEFAPSDTNADGLQNWCRKCQDELSKASMEIDNKTTNNSNLKNQETNMEDFTFYDFKKRSTKNNLGEKQFILYNTKGNYGIAFSIETSEKIIAANLFYLRIRRDNITGALHFLFNAETGARCRVKGKAVVVYNKELVSFLTKAMGISSDTKSAVVNISNNLSRSDEYITFQIVGVDK